MNFQPNEFYHIYNRGNQQQIIFFSDDNYRYFLRKVRKELLSLCEIIAYCLMPNHYHFLIRVKMNSSDSITDILTTSQIGKIDPLARKIGTLQSSYTRAIQKERNFSGSLFQQKAKAKHLDDPHHLFNCFHYIHQNPWKAKIVKEMGHWLYSSYADYCGERKGSLPNKAIAYKYLEIPEDTETFINQSKNLVPQEFVDNIL